VPNNTLIGPQLFQPVGSPMARHHHGVPGRHAILTGFANYFVPLMIGARDVAFPRLNAFGYWLVPLGGILLHYSFLTGSAPKRGWFNYAPLSERAYSSLQGVDYWLISLLVLGLDRDLRNQSHCHHRHLPCAGHEHPARAAVRVDDVHHIVP